MIKKVLSSPGKRKTQIGFLFKLGNVQLDRQTRSFGFHHKVPRSKGAKSQDGLERLFRRFPIPPYQGGRNATLSKTSAHSQWAFGIEVQAPSKFVFQRLRTKVANAMFPRKNNMRCPFLAMSACADIWVDPWAKSCHVNLQKVGPVRPNPGEKNASEQKFKGIDGGTLNCAPAVLSRLFKDSLKNCNGNLRTTRLSSTGQTIFNFP